MECLVVGKCTMIEVFQPVQSGPATATHDAGAGAGTKLRLRCTLPLAGELIGLVAIKCGDGCADMLMLTLSPAKLVLVKFDP